MMRDEFKNLLKYYKNEKCNELITVYSAFNGFAIYKTKKFLNCKYSAILIYRYFTKYYK